MNTVIVLSCLSPGDNAFCRLRRSTIHPCKPVKWAGLLHQLRQPIREFLLIEGQQING